MIITNLQGMILKTNQAMQKYTGLSKEQLLAKNWFELYPIENNIRIINRQKELTEKGTFGPYIIELQSNKNVKTILSVEDYLSRDELGNTQIWSFASDISKEQHALAELSLSQQKYKATFRGGKITQPFGIKKKIRNLLGQKKIRQPLGTKKIKQHLRTKKSCNLLGQKK